MTVRVHAGCETYGSLANDAGEAGATLAVECARARPEGSRAIEFITVGVKP